MTRRWTAARAYRPDAAEMLRRSRASAPHPGPLGAFLADCHTSPGLALVCTGGGFAFGLLATVGVAFIIAWSIG